VLGLLVQFAVHTRSESSGDVVGVKEQRTRKVERLSSGEYRVTTWLKMLMHRRRVRDKAGVELPPSSAVYVTAADVRKSTRDETASSVEASDAKFYWRM
jgi:hypothetical protein